MKKIFLGLTMLFFSVDVWATPAKYQIKVSTATNKPGYSMNGQLDFKFGNSTSTYTNRISSWTVELGTPLNLNAGSFILPGSLPIYYSDITQRRATMVTGNGGSGFFCQNASSAGSDYGYVITSSTNNYVAQYQIGLSVNSFGSIPTLFGRGAYLRIGDSSSTLHNLASEDDLEVTGKLEVNGQVYLDSHTYVRGATLINPIDYAVSITSPTFLGTGVLLISPFRSYAVTISSITARTIDGTNFVCMIEQRSIVNSNSTGTNIWSGNVTVTSTTWTGGGVSDFTVPADYALFLVPVSASGLIDRFMLKYSITRD